MRWEALRLMKLLRKYNPVLVGSVWRGTIHRRSDIDINVYSDDPEEVLATLAESNIKILEKGWVKITREDRWEEAYRILATLSSNFNVEITVKNSAKYGEKERCEVYGDIVTGLNIQELEKVLSRNPTQKFVPF
jgi:predicted nucleotidyltransferase